MKNQQLVFLILWENPTRSEAQGGICSSDGGSSVQTSNNSSDSTIALISTSTHRFDHRKLSIMQKCVSSAARVDRFEPLSVFSLIEQREKSSNAVRLRRTTVRKEVTVLGFHCKLNNDTFQPIKDFASTVQVCRRHYLLLHVCSPAE